jgi:hypothetical protein
MAYETIDTFTSEVSDPDNLNKLIDNINGVAVPNSYFYITPANLTTTSGAYVDMDSTNMKKTITTYGGKLLVFFSGHIEGTASAQNLPIRIVINGSLYGTSGMTVPSNNGRSGFGFLIITPDIPAGDYEVSIQWAVAGGTATLLSGATFGMRGL